MLLQLDDSADFDIPWYQKNSKKVKNGEEVTDLLAIRGQKWKSFIEMPNILLFVQLFFIRIN